jgi:hypothetical protein
MEEPSTGKKGKISGISSPTLGPNASKTPLRQWGFRQCLPFSWTTLRGKYCRHPIAVIGVVDTFGHGQFNAGNTTSLVNLLETRRDAEFQAGCSIIDETHSRFVPFKKVETLPKI